MNDEYLKKLYAYIGSQDSEYHSRTTYDDFKSKMGSEDYSNKVHGYIKGIDSEFRSLEDFNSMIKKKSSNWGSTLGSGSSVSQKTERKATKEIAKTKDLRNVADKGSEIFTGYPGKEKNQYEFSNGNWYELNPEVEKTIKKSKESYVPVGGLPMGGGMFVNPSGEGQDFATPGTSKNSLDAIKNVPKKRIIKDDARIKALNKQFGKNASLDADYETFGDYDNSPEKKDNKYRIKNNSWERLVPGATEWSLISNEGSISALNRRYGKNIDAKKTIVVKPKEIDPFLKVNSNFLAQSEESAQQMLEKNFKGMGFTFEQIGAGDYIKVTPNNGVPSQTFSFNNVGNSTRGAFSSPTGMDIGNSNSKELEKNADQSVKLQSYLRLNASAENEDDLSAVNRIKNNTSSKKESNLDIKSAIENNKYYESEDYKNAFKELTFQQKREEIKRRRSENANLSSTAGTGLAGKLATAIFGEDEKYYENANTLKKFENKLNNSEEYKLFLSEQKKYDAQKGEKYDKLYDEYIIATRSGDKEAIKTAKAKIEGGYSKDLIGDNLNHMTGTQYDLQRDINNFNKRKEKLQLDAKNGNLTQEQYNDAVESLSSEAQRLDVAAKNVAATQKRMNALAGVYVAEKAKSGGFFGNFTNAFVVAMDEVREPLSYIVPALGKDLSGEEEKKIATEAQIITPQQRQYYKDKGYNEQEIKNIFLNNAQKNAIAANKRAIIETFGSDLTTEESKQNLGFVGQSLVGVAASLPSMLTRAIPIVGQIAAFGSMANMSYNAINEEMLNDTDFETTSEADRALVAVPYAVVMGALENIGLKNMTAGKSAILGKYVLGQFAKIVPKKLGKEAVENIVNKEVKSLVGKGVLKVVSGGFAEAETGALQTLVADIGIKKAYNSIRAAYTGEDLKELTGGEAFGTPKSFSEGLMAVGEGALAEAIGGFAMSTVMVGAQGLINGKISLYNEEDLKFFKDFSSDQEFKKLIVSNLKTQMLNGTMTKGEAQSALNDINLVDGVFNSIDENISDEAKLIAFNLINERNRLKKEVVGKDPALSKEKNDRIKDINDKLGTLPLQVLVDNNIERATKLENALKQKGAVIIDGEKINRKAAQTELNKINQKVEDAEKKQEEDAIKATIPEEISSLKDDEPFTKRVETLEEIPEEFRDRAQLLPLTEVETRKNIFGLPIGKKGSKLVGGGYTYTLTGKEAKDYAIQEQAAGEVPVQPTTAVGEEVVQGEPTAESQVLTEEGKAEEVRSSIETEKNSIEDNLQSLQKNLEDATSKEDRSYYETEINLKEQELELFNSNPIEYVKSKLEYFSEKDENGELITPYSYNKYKDLYDALTTEATTEVKAEEVVLTEKQRIEAEIAKKKKGKTPKYARNVAALITPATTRNFDSTTKRMQKLSLKYDALVKKMEKSKVVTNEDEKELKKLENQILGQVKKEITEGISKIKGVEVLFRDNYSGAWGGVAEPSMNMSLKITEDADTEAISRLLQEFGEKYSQDAIIIETTSEFSDDIINEKIKPKFSYSDNRGFLHYPQIFYKFASTPTAKQLADLGKLLKENGINDYSFNNNELKVSIISFEGNQTETQLKQDYEKRHEKIKQSVINALGLTEDGDVVSTEVRYRKSRYVGSKNDGDTSTEERPYDRSDIFKEVKEDVIKAQEEGLELGSIRDKQIALQEKGRDLNSAEKRRLAKLTSTVQPIVQETFETKEKDFEEAKKEVESIADKAIRRLKGFVSKFAIKRPTRASVKTLRWYSADTEKLGDGARVNIIVPTNEEANLVFKNIDEGNKKDSQLRRINEATELGYPKRLIEIRAKNGVISEIQVMTPEGYLAKDGYKFFPPEQQEEAKQKLEETQQKFGWAIPDGLGHYFYEIERDFNVDKSLREEAKRLSLKYYNAFLNNVKWDEQQFADEMSAFKDRVDSDKKIGWDAGNEGKSPKSLDAFLNKEKAAPVVKAGATKARGKQTTTAKKEAPTKFSWKNIKEEKSDVIIFMKQLQVTKLNELQKIEEPSDEEIIKINELKAKIKSANTVLNARERQAIPETIIVEKPKPKSEPIDKGTRVRGSGTTEFSIVIDEKKGTARVQLKKVGTFTPKRATPEANLIIQTDDKRGRFVETKNKTKVYIDDVITPAKVETTKAKVTTKSTVKAAPVKKKVKVEAEPVKEETEAEKISRGAEMLKNMSEDERDIFLEDWIDGNIPRESLPGGNMARNLYEAKKLVPKPTSKPKRTTIDNAFSLSMDQGFVINIDGVVYGLNKYEDPDATSEATDNYGDPKQYVWAYTDMSKGDEVIETWYSDIDELINEIKSLKEEAPAPAKESTTGEDTIFNNIEVIQKEIDDINKDIETAKENARKEILPIREQIKVLKQAIGKEGTIMDLEADIEDAELILKEELYGKENDTYKGLVSDLNKKAQELQEEFNKLGSLKISSAENKTRLSEYIDDAIAKLNSLNKFTYAGIGVGTSIATMKLILKGINALVKAAESISLDEAIARMYTKHKKRHPKVKREQFIKEINDFLDSTFVKQKTNKQDLQDTQDRLAEFKEAVKLAISLDRKESEKLRIEAERVVRKMLTGKVDTLDSIQMKSIMLRLAKFNVLSQRQYDKFIDYVDKIIGIAGYDAKVDKANINRKNAKKNLPKLGDISSDLLDPLSRLLSINAKLIPSDVFESYSEIVEMLSQRDAVLKLNKRDDLNKSIDKIIESIESNEQRVSDLKELYDNFEDKVVEDKVVNYAETLDEMLKVGIINQSEHKLMKTFKSKIQGPKVKAKMTEQEIADEKVELINEINNTTITLDEIVGDEFRLERDLIKRLQELLKNKKTLESLNNKDLKDLLRVIDNINNGFVSNATQEMVEKLNFIEKSILLESSIPENFKNIAKKINQTLAKRVSKRINVAPLFNIDQQLGDFKTKNIFNSVFNESAKAQQGYQSAITLIQDELDKIERGIATSFENEPNKIILSQFKMMVYMMQLEYDSNPTKQEGSKKQVHQAMKTLDETIKFAKKNSEKSGYNDLDIAQMESIKKEFEKNNEIDIDKLYNSFNEAEKNGLKKLEEINNRMTKFATYTATVINGKKIVPLKNYISYTVINESDILSASETTDQINNINANMDPGTVSKNLEERDGKAHPVYLNPFYATNSSSRSVLLNYHMTEPVRTARKTLRNAKTLLEEKEKNTLKKEMTLDEKKIFEANIKDQYDILNAITGAYNTATKDLLESNFTQSTKWLEFLKRQGYRSMLASGTRAAAELSSNIAFVLLNNPRDMRRGVSKEIKEIEGVDRKSIMTNLKSNVTSRVQPTSLINSPFVELTANANRSSKSKNTKTEIRNGVRQAWDETGKQYVDVVAGVADYLISKPDQVIMRRLWFGSFSRTFEKEVGIKPDFDKIIKNDEEYMDKYKDALEKATTMADKQVISAGSSMNSYMGILQNVVRQDDKGGVIFVKEFNRFMNKFTVQEYYTAREGVRALVGNGTISREEGIQVLAAVTLRMTIYSVFTRLFSEGLSVVARSLGFGGDDDDDDKTTKQKISQGILSSITTLVFGRYFGNFIRVAENALIELANKEYGEAIGLRDGEYDPYKDAIQFNQLQEGKVDKLTDFVKVVAGPLSPVIGTAELAYKLATSSKPEGERAKLTRAKELYRRLPLEIGGLAGVVPFYKDFRKIVMEGVYKELKKETKETAVKKEAEAKVDAEEIVQKTSILKEMMDSGRYTKEGIKKELRKIKDPEYRKAERKIEEDMVKAILDQQTIKYSNKEDFEKREKEKAKIAFKMYHKRREESLKILNELKNRMKALEYDEEYIVKDSFGSGDNFGSDGFGGSDKFGSDSFGDDNFGSDDD